MTNPLFEIANLADVGVDIGAVETIAHNLDLREPNKAAVANVAAAYAEWHDNPDTLEVVVYSAVGVGKTYVMAGLIEYLASVEGIRNIAIITPSTVITEKTIANFTPGSAKSLLDGMESDPAVVTADNFNTPAMRAIMDDDSRVKLYIFNVQALLTPKEGSKMKRRTHDFQEGLGRGFYEHLQSCPDLVVLADEHHTYRADEYSAAVRNLNPTLLVGLTGTPQAEDEDKIVFRYPLADAIADGYVKLPVIVGRQDDRRDLLTKLNDGARLLAEKQAGLDDYSKVTGAPRVNAVMLVLCSKIEEAEEVAALIESDAVAGGAYRGHVLTVHSKNRREDQDQDLRNLESVEHPDSPVRVIVAVDKLKEGWDVKNVYVLASLRPSISEILTEQTLGRGLRLPYGERTEVEFIDTLEVLAHDRFEDLLKKRDSLNAQFISFRTRQKVILDRRGVATLRTETTQTSTAIFALPPAGEPRETGAEPVTGTPMIATIDSRLEAGETLIQKVHPDWGKTGGSPVKVPYLAVTKISVPWSLEKITDFEAFRDIARRLTATDTSDLRRTVVTAERRGDEVSIGTREAADVVEGFNEPLPLEDVKLRVKTAVLQSRIAPSKVEERRHVDRILEVFFEALGEDADQILTNHWATAANRIVAEIERQAKNSQTSVHTEEQVHLAEPFGVRVSRPHTTTDLHRRMGMAERNRLGYESWRKSLYPQVWFDSDLERRAALILDSSDEIAWWVRLHGGEFPIAVNDKKSYHPDFLACGVDGDWWVVETKADRDLEAEDVARKAQAAREWANKMSVSDQAPGRWNYLLVGEKDVDQAKGSWTQLKAFGRS